MNASAQAARADRRPRRGNRRGERRGGGVGAGSCETIPDQELQRAVEPDLRRGLAALGQGRAEAHEPPVVVGFGQRDRVALERLRPDRPAIRRERRRLRRRRRTSCPPIVSPFSGTPMIASSVSPPVLISRLAGGADRGERDDVDLRSDPFGARNRFCRQRAQDRLQPVVALVMEMVGLGRRKQDAVDAGTEDRTRDSDVRPARKARMTSVSAFSRSLTAAGPELSAESASTSTICRSSRAK